MVPGAVAVEGEEELPPVWTEVVEDVPPMSSTHMFFICFQKMTYR